MLVNEDEAKTKWCPMPRHDSMADSRGYNCIASSCMMWKWDNGVPVTRFPGESWEGCCGLASDTTHDRHPAMVVK